MGVKVDGTRGLNRAGDVDVVLVIAHIEQQEARRRHIPIQIDPAMAFVCVDSDVCA